MISNIALKGSSSRRVTCSLQGWPVWLKASGAWMFFVCKSLARPKELRFGILRTLRNFCLCAQSIKVWLKNYGYDKTIFSNVGSRLCKNFVIDSTVTVSISPDIRLSIGWSSKLTLALNILAPSRVNVGMCKVSGWYDASFNQACACSLCVILTSFACAAAKTSSAHWFEFW